MEVNLDALESIADPYVELQVIDQIRRAGFLCSMDDFGSGYSSLNLFKDIKMDTIKLDGAFFRTKPEDSSRSKPIVASVVGLAQKLYNNGIQRGGNSGTDGFLRGIQYDMIQGFVVSKPVEAKNFERLAFGRVVTDGSGSIHA